MNWSFWKGAHSSLMDPCETIEPLLALFADQMASAAEGRRVEAHLRECVSCRDTLLWMQATRRTLASRPVALPPADLRARIAEAIAASDAAPAKPARSFTLRPAYAAAASLTALGVFLIGHSLYAPHTALPSKPQTPQMSSNLPSIAPTPTSIPTLKPVPIVKRTLPSSQHSERMAALPKDSSAPAEDAPAQPLHHIISEPVGRAHVLTLAITGSHLLSSHSQKLHVMMAVRPGAEKVSDHVPSMSAPTPPTHGPEVATAVPPVVNIGAPKIVPVEPSPSVLVASSPHDSEVPIQATNLLGSVQEYALKHRSSIERNLSLPSNQAIRGAVYRTAITSGIESPVSFADIHSP